MRPVISTFAPPATVTVDDPATDSRCFSEGPVVRLIVRPTTLLPGTVSAGTIEIPISPSGGLAPSNANGDVGATGFTIGDEVVIGAGTADAEIRTISGYGSLILDRPLTHAHRTGELVVVIAVHTSPIAATGTDLRQPIWWSVAALLAGLLCLAAGRRRSPYPVDQLRLVDDIQPHLAVDQVILDEADRAAAGRASRS